MVENFQRHLGELVFFATVLLLSATFSFAAGKTGVLKDSRDGKTYKTVKIGDKVWMAENLNYQTSESKCYENKLENCEKYGRLYTWDDAKKACPTGWHLPSNEDFGDLAKVAGGREDAEFKSKWYGAGTVLKSKTGWVESSGKSGNGTDSLGFAALPAGLHLYNNYTDDFHHEFTFAYFWSSTENDEGHVYLLLLIFDSEDADLYLSPKDSGFSVRCIKD